MQTNKMIEKIINGMNDRIEELEKYPLKASNLIAKKLNNKIETLENKIKAVEEQIPDINQETTETIKLNDKYDILESKYYSLRSELDGIYSVLEMDALDIQALQDNVFEGFTRDQKNNVNLNKDDINKLIKEVAETDFNDDGTIKEEE